MKKIIGIGIGLFLSLVAIAQPGYNWPEDKDKRQETEIHIVTIRDDIRAQNYTSALPKIEWLLKNTPNVHKSLYINGAIVYANMVKTDENENKYEDLTLMMYDKRIDFFGQEANVLNLKGEKAWLYLNDRTDKKEELYTLYKKIYELNGSKMYPANTIAYMDMACKMKTMGKIDVEQVTEIYNNINTILLAHSEDLDYQRMKKPVNEIFTNCGQTYDQNSYIDIVSEEAAKEKGVIESPVFVAERDAIPEGGLQNWFTIIGKYCSENYPEEDRKAGISGRVYVSFIVEKDGSLTDIKVIKGVSKNIDMVAIEAIKLVPKWEPATQGGRKVRLIKRLPISFN